MVAFHFTSRHMDKRRVLLICSPHLFGESMEQILRGVQDMELIGPWEAAGDLCSRIPEARPDVVVIVELEQHEPAFPLVASLIELFPELPVIRARLTESYFRIFSTHLLPARASDLVQAIRSLPAWEPHIAGNDLSKGDGCNEENKSSLVHAPLADGDPGDGDDPDGAGRTTSPGPGQRGDNI
jgi:hypothetical protein